jgi:TRAP-type uncharacterized transport system fused permease subunit
VALPKYFIGLSFILSLSGASMLVLPAIRTLPLAAALPDMVLRYAVSALAILALNVATLGWFGRPLGILERLVLGAAAVLLFYPTYRTDVVGVLIVAGFFVRTWIERRRAARHAAEAPR